MENFILEIPNFLPEDFCQEIIECFEKSSKKSDGDYLSISFGKVIVRDKYSVQLCINQDENFKEIDKKLASYIKKLINDYEFHLFKNYFYNQKYHPLERVLKRDCYDVGYMIQKIKSDATPEWHTDGEPGFDWFIQSIVYLNTVNKGGRTFLVTKDSKGVKPETGKALVFPASWTFPHSGEKLGEGEEKYILSFTINVSKIDYAERIRNGEIYKR